MNTMTVKGRNRLILSSGASMLALALLISPVGRSSAASTLDWIVEAVNVVTEFPYRIVHNIRHFSLTRLDPTCPQCF